MPGCTHETRLTTRFGLRRSMRRGLHQAVLLGGLLLPVLGAPAPAPAEEPNGIERFVGPEGELRFDFSATADWVRAGDWVHLGSWFVPAGDAAGFHHVYTRPGVVEAFRESGAFPDGAVLVKEIRAHRRGDYTTGKDVALATAPVQWFVMVKDAKGRFPESPLWGNGWGWGLFKADDPARNVASDFRSDCLGCHAPAQARDWVYTEAYPVLHE